MDNNKTKETLDDYRYSIGNTPMVDTLIKVFNEDTNIIDTVALNVSTLLRNTYLADTPFSDWVTNTHKEILDITSELSQVMFNSVANPKILLYFIDYRHLIPDVLERPMTKSRVLMLEGLTKLIPLLNTSGFGTPGEGEDIINLKYGPLRANPADLHRMIRRLGNKKNTCLVTHLPLDYHIYRYIKHVRYVHSYTGAVSRLKDLSTKLFGTNNIPFNRHTHALLGDAVSFKSTLSTKLKREVLDIARKDRWELIPESGILRSMRNHQFNPPFTICV